MNNFDTVAYLSGGLICEGYKILNLSKTGNGDVYPYNSSALYFIKENTSVDLTATPSENYAFIKWSGTNIDSTEEVITIDMDIDRNLNVEFRRLRTLSTTVYGPGDYLSDTTSVEILEGEQVILLPTTEEDFVFEKWIVNNVTKRDAILTLNMYEDKDVKVFYKTKRFNCVYRTIGRGTVVNKPDNLIYYGTTLDMTAVPDSGYEFYGWDSTLSDYTDSTINNYTVYSDISIIPIFNKKIYNVTITTDGNGTVSPFEGTEEVEYGTRLTLVASPNTGYVFSDWSGNIESVRNNFVYTVVGDASITAEFEPE